MQHTHCVNRHWLPTNLMSLSHFSLFVFVKPLKKFSKQNWFTHSSFSEGKQKERGEMPLYIRNYIPLFNSNNIFMFSSKGESFLKV